MAAALERFWEVRSYFKEAREHYELLLSRAGENVPPTVLARALAAAGRIAWCEDRNKEALAYFGDALRIHQELGGRHEEGIVRAFLGFTARNEENRELARGHFEP